MDIPKSKVFFMPKRSESDLKKAGTPKETTTGEIFGGIHKKGGKATVLEQPTTEDYLGKDDGDLQRE